ncbi:hypothetical protein GFS31_01010 [Leptolyngbya sp. BL0902]|uniref:hypothetical protein n=1 Tax=Leptolyngbya sp. BL0902 TaxID=1115757 RepID=UPI0018E7EDE4|nr:hypothetical protein [Leptolyngbya sp. BL0902]QQE63436.1 hypothetical protein GFS31_01010 [Leptolyngbya sp. BL0902]
MGSAPGSAPLWVALCFWPAGLGLLSQGLQPVPLPQRLLALALGLMLMEQSHMARVDVQQALAAWKFAPTPQLTRFMTVLAVTILGELMGFYLAAGGWLGLGMITILLSLLGFNLFANGRFEGYMFQPAGPRSRLGVIAIDLVALGLALLWVVGWGRLAVAGVLLTVSLAYGVAKAYAYATGRSSLAQPTSPAPAAYASRGEALAIHIPNAAQQHPQPAQQNR